MVMYTDCVYHISGVLVCVLTACAVGRGFEPRSGQANDYETTIVASTLST